MAQAEGVGQPRSGMKRKKRQKERKQRHVGCPAAHPWEAQLGVAQPMAFPSPLLSSTPLTPPPLQGERAEKAQERQAELAELRAARKKAAKAAKAASKQ